MSPNLYMDTSILCGIKENGPFVCGSYLKYNILKSQFVYPFQLRMERQHFTREELDHYKEAFSLYDTHDKGYITTKELGALIRYTT